MSHLPIHLILTFGFCTHYCLNRIFSLYIPANIQNIHGIRNQIPYVNYKAQSAYFANSLNDFFTENVQNMAYIYVFISGDWTIVIDISEVAQQKSYMDQNRGMKLAMKSLQTETVIICWIVA